MTTASRSDSDLGLLLAACCERLVRAVVGTLAAAGYDYLTPSHALAVLLIGDGVDTVTQLAERVGMTTQAMSKICTALAGEGLLDRQPHAADARSRRLTLTADGQRVRTLMRTAGADAERAWIELVGAETLNTVRGALAAFAQASDPVARPSQVRIRFA